MLELSSRQKWAIQQVFSKNAHSTVQECIVNKAGRTIPFCGNSSPEQLDRIRFAIIKLSNGCTEKLEEAISLAHSDWRQLLISANFGQDPFEHDNWFKRELDIIAWWHC